MLLHKPEGKPISSLILYIQSPEQSKKRHSHCLNHQVHVFYVSPREELTQSHPLCLIPTASSGGSQTMFSNSLEVLISEGYCCLWYCCRGRQELKSAKRGDPWGLWNWQKVRAGKPSIVRCVVAGIPAHLWEEKKCIKQSASCDSDNWEWRTQRKDGCLLFLMQFCVIWLIITSVHRSLPNTFQNKSPRAGMGRNCPLCICGF